MDFLSQIFALFQSLLDPILGILATLFSGLTGILG